MLRKLRDILAYRSIRRSSTRNSQGCELCGLLARIAAETRPDGPLKRLFRQSSQGSNAVPSYIFPREPRSHAPRQSAGGADQQPAAAYSRFLKKTATIDPLFHIRLLFSELITSARLEFYRVQLADQTQTMDARAKSANYEADFRNRRDE